MTTGLDNQVLTVIKGTIDSYAEPNIRWRDGIFEQLKYALGFIWLYRDNTKRTLNMNRVSSYGFSIYLLNTKSKSTEEMTNRGLTTVAFFPQSSSR